MKCHRMNFDSHAYSAEVASILALDGAGDRLIPLVAQQCSSPAAHAAIQASTPRKLFPNAPSPEAAVAGLWLYFSCFEEAHGIAQDLSTIEGSLWHGIIHRQEPDSGNAAYWFRRAGPHPTFPALVKKAAEIVSHYPEAEFRPSARWDPFGFILFCERARAQPGSRSEAAALEIQRAEWQLLFDHCALPQG